MKSVLIPCDSVERTEEILRPRGEALPKEALPDRHPHLLNHNQKYAGPECGAMNLSNRPQIVAQQQEQERVAAHLRYSEIPPCHGDWPTHESRVKERDRGDKHEPLMPSRIEAFAEAKINQRREHQHIGYRNDVKGLDSRSRFAWRKVSRQAIRGSYQAQYGHETRQTEAEQAHSAVHIYAAASNE